MPPPSPALSPPACSRDADAIVASPRAEEEWTPPECRDHDEDDPGARARRCPHVAAQVAASTRAAAAARASPLPARRAANIPLDVFFRAEEPPKGAAATEARDPRPPLSRAIALVTTTTREAGATADPIAREVV